jgi:hypothetical protein
VRTPVLRCSSSKLREHIGKIYPTYGEPENMFAEIVAEISKDTSAPAHGAEGNAANVHHNSC